MFVASLTAAAEPRSCGLARPGVQRRGSKAICSRQPRRALQVCHSEISARQHLRSLPKLIVLSNLFIGFVLLSLTCFSNRYSPKIVDIVQGHLRGDLSEDVCPFIKPPSIDHRPGQWARQQARGRTGGLLSPGGMHARRESVIAGRGGAAAATGESVQYEAGQSHRRSKPTRFMDKLQSTKASSSSSGPGASAASHSSGVGAAADTATANVLPPVRRVVSGPRVIVFIVGGVSQLEAAALERLSAQTKMEIIYGSTSLSTPRDFLEQLALTGTEDVTTSPASGALA